MKIRIISGSVVIILGLLIALGPQFLFKVCDAVDGSFMQCHWSAQAELGVGFLIAVLGLVSLFAASLSIRLGLVIGIFLSGVLALLIPHVLIGGCTTDSMPCRHLAFPAITLISIVLLIGSGLYIAYLSYEKQEIGGLYTFW